MDTYKLYNIKDNDFSKLPIEERIKILNIKNVKDYQRYCGMKIAPRWSFYFFSDGEDTEVMKIINKMEKTERLLNKPIKKKLNLNIPLCIQEDYKHFNIKYECKHYTQQDKMMKLEECNIDMVLNGDADSIRDRVFTEKLYNHFIKNDKIINIEFYEYLIFNNIITYNIDDYFTEEGDIIDNKMVNKYYTETFRPYFYQKYKAILKEINIDDDRKLKNFDFFYRKINVNIYIKKENPKEYNKYSVNKRNLRSSYKMYLEGVPIEEIPINDKLKYMLFIIENCDPH
eukprot:SAG11_NODE_1332_length_5179_cov_193.229724_6_plen_285_part_00